jgi:hypothetical protein
VATLRASVPTAALEVTARGIVEVLANEALRRRRS